MLHGRIWACPRLGAWPGYSCPTAQNRAERAGAASPLPPPSGSGLFASIPHAAQLAVKLRISTTTVCFLSSFTNQKTFAIIMKSSVSIAAFMGFLLLTGISMGQIGRRFPSERKLVKDPVTGAMLTFLTSTPTGDSKIYQTHNQWTSDKQWLIFRSGRARGEAMAVNEQTGEMVQVSEGGYVGMLNIARNSMKLFFMRDPQRDTSESRNDSTRRRPPASLQIVEVDLEKLFVDSKSGKLRPASVFVVPPRPK
jgi:hypothetical protein